MYNELYHHGIIGMRWGKRNGPPYPLNADQMTSTQKKHNRVSDWSSDSISRKGAPSKNTTRRIVRKQHEMKNGVSNHSDKIIRYETNTKEKKAVKPAIKTAAAILSASAALTVGYCAIKNKAMASQINKAVSKITKTKEFFMPTIDVIRNSGKYLAGPDITTVTRSGAKSIGINVAKKTGSLAKTGMSKVKTADPSAAIKAINNMPTKIKVMAVSATAYFAGDAVLYNFMHKNGLI